MAGAIGGVPASNFAGSSAGVKRSGHTRLIMLPPPRKAGMASSSVFATIQDADAGGAEHFVAAEGEEVGTEFADVRRQVGHALGGIDEDDRAGGVRAAGDFLNRVDGAEDVRDRCDRDHFGAVGKERIERVENQLAIIGDRDVLQNCAGALGELLPGHQIRMVLHRGDEDFVAGFDVGVAPTASDEVDASGRARGEDDFERLFCADECADFFAGRFVLIGAPFAKRVDAAVDVRVIVLVHAAKNVDHLLRSLRAGSVIEKHQRMIAVDGLLENGEIRAKRGGEQLR